MRKKEARALCRTLAIQHNRSWWSLCWNKNAGYYPAVGNTSVDTNHICWVRKNGVYAYATKENEKKHHLKGNERK